MIKLVYVIVSAILLIIPAVILLMYFSTTVQFCNLNYDMKETVELTISEGEVKTGKLRDYKLLTNLLEGYYVVHKDKGYFSHFQTDVPIQFHKFKNDKPRKIYIPEENKWTDVMYMDEYYIKGYIFDTTISFGFVGIGCIIFFIVAVYLICARCENWNKCKKCGKNNKLVSAKADPKSYV